MQLARFCRHWAAHAWRSQRHHLFLPALPACAALSASALPAPSRTFPTAANAIPPTAPGVNLWVHPLPQWTIPYVACFNRMQEGGIRVALPDTYRLCAHEYGQRPMQL